MIKSGELFLLNGKTAGELRPLPTFVNKKVLLVSASWDRAYVVIGEDNACSVWCFQDYEREPIRCPEFDVIEEVIRQIAIGESHLVVLTQEGTVYSRGPGVYGSVGHGGAKGVPDFTPVVGLKDRKVKFVAAGPSYSIAITHEGDVFSWGQSFHGETGQISQVDTVPRFAANVSKFRVVEVSCGTSHILARTEMQQCIAWGENTCGQLGIGCKTKPTHKPHVLDAIPSQILTVSAGWAHSVAVGIDGRAYSWGLNSHGQLGLGDTVTRLAPHLLHSLVETCQVESAHAARAMTIFRAVDCRVLLCGQVPRAQGEPVETEFAPRRPGDKDPRGCVLCPVPLTLSSGSGFGISRSELVSIAVFDRGAVGFARSSTYRVEPNLAPIQGGTQVCVFVTGLPYEKPARKSKGATQGATQRAPLLHESIPVRVRLRSNAPLCDTVVVGRIIAEDTVEFWTPDVTLSPLGTAVEQGLTAAVDLQVSIDDGFTWTRDRSAVQPVTDKTLRLNGSEKSLRSSKNLQGSLRDLKKDLEATTRMGNTPSSTATVLWYCRWPKDGPSHVEPTCAPVKGGSELLLHVDLPTRMPTSFITVKFACTPLQSMEDPELEAASPMRTDGREMFNPSHEELARLPLAGSMDIFVCGWLDPGGRGVRCISPPFYAEHVKYFKHSIALSLDGRKYLGRSLPFDITDLHVEGLEPSLGSLLEPTEVSIKAVGLVSSDIHKVRLDFPAELGWPSRTVPALYDHTLGKMTFMMPELSTEVRDRVEKAATEAVPAAEPADVAEGQAASDEAPPQVPADPTGGLGGLQVFVELSLNGQSYTEDKVAFTFHGHMEPEAVRMIALPEGVVIEPPKEEPKGKTAGKKVVEEVVEPAILPSATLGCEVLGIVESPFAAMRVELVTKAGDEEHKPFKAVDLPARVELVPPLAIPPPPIDPKDKNPPPPVEEPPPPRLGVLVLAPSIRMEDIPEGAMLYMKSFHISINGQFFAPCPEVAPMRLEPLPMAAPPAE
mmetsp:Transcript_19951/g.43520  ORF Transcript_19951/g.43520 Transcript_19951/m.43520 type:complete len:1003 (+) Transcript_19951:104-3112(+)